MSEVRKVSATGGEKGSKDARMDLIPVRPLTELAELYGEGAKKYAVHNWRNGYDWSLSYAAAMRHLTQFWNGEDRDEEMGSKHVINAAFHLFALAQFMDDFPEYDDRFKKPATRLKYRGTDAEGRFGTFYGDGTPVDDGVTQTNIGKAASSPLIDDGWGRYDASMAGDK